MMWLIWKIIRLISTRSFYILDDFYFFFFLDLSEKILKDIESNFLTKASRVFENFKK